MSGQFEEPALVASEFTPGGAPVGEFLPWDDEDFLLDPYPWYGRVLREMPVYLDPSGTYVITRYDDVMEFGKHPAMSVEPGWDAAGPWSIARESVIGHDQPEHTRLRRVTNPWFTPKRVREWVETTVAATDEVLDGLDDGLVDGWLQLSVVPTHRTMCRILEVPDDQIDPVRQAMERVMPMLRVRTRPGEIEMAEESFAFLADHASEFIRSKQADPGEGLIDDLLAATQDGRMSQTEMRSLVALLYGLGHMDVGYSVAAALRALSQHPEVFEQFRTDASARDRIVEETIRLDPPEPSIYRTTMDELTIRGVTIPAGSRLRYILGAANRDPEAFPDPDVFDPSRSPDRGRNLSFGVGMHSCMGQVLARAEVLAVLETVAGRYSRLEPAGEVTMQSNDFSRHYTSVPLRLVR